jgi:hypothetical protein
MAEKDSSMIAKVIFSAVIIILGLITLTVVESVKNSTQVVDVFTENLTTQIVLNTNFDTNESWVYCNQTGFATWDTSQTTCRQFINSQGGLSPACDAPNFCADVRSEGSPENVLLQNISIDNRTYKEAKINLLATRQGGTPGLSLRARLKNSSGSFEDIFFANASISTGLNVFAVNNFTVAQNFTTDNVRLILFGGSASQVDNVTMILKFDGIAPAVVPIFSASNQLIISIIEVILALVVVVFTIFLIRK